MPGEGPAPGVRGLVEAEHDETEARVVAPFVEEGAQTPRPVGCYGDVSPGVRPEPPVHGFIVGCGDYRRAVASPARPRRSYAPSP